jgi:hypothetical protein
VSVAAVYEPEAGNQVAGIAPAPVQTQPTSSQQAPTETPQEVAERNASVPFLTITDQSGDVVAYAEDGVVVSKAQFDADVEKEAQAALQQQLLSEVAPTRPTVVREGVGTRIVQPPGPLELTFENTTGASQTVYFSSKEEAAAFVSSLVAGKAQAYALAGAEFGSSSSASAYAKILSASLSSAELGAPSQPGYTYGGQTYSSVQELLDAVSAANPGAAVTPVYLTTDSTGYTGLYGPFIGPTKQGPLYGVEITKGPSSTVAPVGTNYLPQLGLLGKFLTGVYRTPELFEIDTEDLMGWTQKQSNPAARFGGFVLAELGGIGTAATGLFTFNLSPAVKLGTAYRLLIPSEAIGAAAGIYALGGLIPAKAALPAGAAINVVGGYVQGGNAVFGVGSSSRSPAGIAENAALGLGLTYAFSRLAPELVASVRNQFELFSNPTRPVAGSLLANYTPPAELGEPEFEGGIPGRLVQVEGSSYTRVYVDQGSEPVITEEQFGGSTLRVIEPSTIGDQGLSLKGEADIVESSLLSQRDLAQLTGGAKGFIEGAEARAPPKLATPTGGPAEGEDVADYFSYARKASLRSGAVTDAFAKYDQELADEQSNLQKEWESKYSNSSGNGSQTVLRPPAEETVAISRSSDDVLDEAIAEARRQASIRASIVRALARGTSESAGYSVVAYPPGTRAPQAVRGLTVQVPRISIAPRFSAGPASVQADVQSLRNGQTSALRVDQSSILDQGLRESSALRTFQTEVQGLQQLQAEIQASAGSSSSVPVPTFNNLPKRRKHRSRAPGYGYRELMHPVSLDISGLSFGAKKQRRRRKK